jgi:hypothetical protein
MDWKQYEKEIELHFKEQYPTANIVRDARIIGKLSKQERQIDLLVEDHPSDFLIRVVVDAKFRNKRIDINDVEAFLGVLRDVEAHVGVMISPLGYSEAAINRAYQDDVDLQLDILSFEDLKEFQSPLAIPSAGGHGVLLRAPLGWIVDGQRRREIVACMYRRGLDLAEAGKERTWMYVNFWSKEEGADIEALVAIQDERLRRRFPNAEIKHSAFVSRKDAKTMLRSFKEPSYPALEFTAFVEFEHFIFFAVLFTPAVTQSVNLRKLRFVARSVIPLAVEHKG